MTTIIILLILILIWGFILYKIENCNSISSCIRKSGSTKNFILILVGVPIVIYFIFMIIF